MIDAEHQKAMQIILKHSMDCVMELQDQGFELSVGEALVAREDIKKLFMEQAKVFGIDLTEDK